MPHLTTGDLRHIINSCAETSSGAAPLGCDPASMHPLLVLATATRFDPWAAFFAQPVAPMENAKVVAANSAHFPVVDRVAPTTRDVSADEHRETVKILAAQISGAEQKAIVGRFAFGPILGTTEAGDSTHHHRMISRSFHFPNRPPYWMGRTYEIPCECRVAQTSGTQPVVWLDADVKGAGRTEGAAFQGNPELDGLLPEDEAWNELFVGDLLLAANARSSLGAYLLTSNSLPTSCIREGKETPCIILVRYFREARRVGNLEAYDLVRRYLVLKYCNNKLAYAGELDGETDLSTYLIWFCRQMATNAARFAQSGVLHCALHPQNVTLAAEVVDHGMTVVLPRAARRLSGREWLGAHHPTRDAETFENQPGRMLVLVCHLRDMIEPLCSAVTDIDLTEIFVTHFRDLFADNARFLTGDVRADDFDFLESACWLYTPPDIDQQALNRLLESKVEPK